MRAYCQERGNNVDPEKFCDFYASKGWKVGNQQMKDWRACVRTWEKDAQKTTTAKRVVAQEYSQRDYSGADDEAMRAFVAMMEGKNG